MTKDRTFQVRLDGEDRKRLNVIAKEMSAPAATAIRILIKREFDRIEIEKQDRKARRA